MFFVYILENQRDHSWYIGYTSNLRRRLSQHHNHEVYTTRNGTWIIIYYEAYQEKLDAAGREVFLKSGAGWRFLKKQLRHYLAHEPERP